MPRKLKQEYIPFFLTKKQQTCSHQWESENSGIDRSGSLRQFRRWCTLCGFHEIQKQAVKWGEWHRLPDIKPRKK